MLLVTDLDGTFLPEHSAWEENLAALQTIRELVDAQQLQLVFATGRHLSSVVNAIKSFQLPVPRTVIGDVGTTIYHRGPSAWELDPNYVQEMRKLQRAWNRDEIVRRANQLPGVKQQETEKNSEFKLSFYCPVDQLDETKDACEAICQQLAIGASVISSVDPSGDIGLIDFLPLGASKAFAVEWLRERYGGLSNCVYAGDSGNDLNVFLSDCPSILVGNATPTVALRVAEINATRSEETKVYCAQATATSGVLEGLRAWSETFGRVNATQTVQPSL